MRIIFMKKIVIWATMLFLLGATLSDAYSMMRGRGRGGARGGGRGGRGGGAVRGGRGGGGGGGHAAVPPPVPPPAAVVPPAIAQLQLEDAAVTQKIQDLARQITHIQRKITAIRAQIQAPGPGPGQLLPLETYPARDKIKNLQQFIKIHERQQALLTEYQGIIQEAIHDRQNPAAHGKIRMLFRKLKRFEHRCALNHYWKTRITEVILLSALAAFLGYYVGYKFLYLKVGIPLWDRYLGPTQPSASSSPSPAPAPSTPPAQSGAPSSTPSGGTGTGTGSSGTHDTGSGTGSAGTGSGTGAGSGSLDGHNSSSASACGPGSVNGSGTPSPTPPGGTGTGAGSGATNTPQSGYLESIRQGAVDTWGFLHDKLNPWNWFGTHNATGAQ
jgi:hypothetical protein